MDREGFVCESGVYFLNLKPCHACGQRCMTKAVPVESTSEEDGSEHIRYKHVCEYCGHVLAEHEYSVTVNEERRMHVYEMHCMLCGEATDERSIDPVDPRQMVSVDDF